METWGDVLAALDAAIESADWERGEDVVEVMQREAAHSGDLGQEASALFHEGVFADAKGDLARAESCFAAAVEVDRRVHGPKHGAVADALNSLALVRDKAGNLNGAADAYVEAARIYEAVTSEMRAIAFVYAGDACLRAQRYEESQSMFEAALEAPAPNDYPWHKLAWQGLHATFAKRKMYREAMSAAADGSREPLGANPRFRETQARIMCDLGHLGVVFGLAALCGAAYRAARELAQDPAVRAEAQRGLDTYVKTPFEGPLDAFRVVFFGERDGEVYVLHCLRGLLLISGAADVDIGDTVDIDEENQKFLSRLSSARPGS